MFSRAGLFFGSPDLLCVPSCPLWLGVLLFRLRRSVIHPLHKPLSRLHFPENSIDALSSAHGHLHVPFFPLPCVARAPPLAAAAPRAAGMRYLSFYVIERHRHRRIVAYIYPRARRRTKHAHPQHRSIGLSSVLAILLRRVSRQHRKTIRAV